MRVLLTLLAMLIWSVLAATAISAEGIKCPDRPSCSGCGCKGGPGYRVNATGKCAGFKQLARLCGNPPDPDRCTFENAPGTGANYSCALDLPAGTQAPKFR